MKPSAAALIVGLCLSTPLLADPPGVIRGRAELQARARRPVSLLSSPVRLAQTGNGNLLVSDYRGQRIVEMDNRGRTIVRSFSIPGRPLAVAATDSQVYVGNESTHRVEVYDPTGQRLFNLGGLTHAFEQPTDIAIDIQQQLVFVVDGQAKLVKVFDMSAGAPGTLLGTIPPSGPDPSLLTSPTGIALDTQEQEVLVSDFGASDGTTDPRVQIFSYAGSHLVSISGQAGMFGRRFSRPQGLAVDGAGHVFLADSWLGAVIVLDRSTGAQLATLGSYGTGPGQLALPLDIVIDQNSQDVLVTNNRPGRIEVFVEGAVLP